MYRLKITQIKISLVLELIIREDVGVNELPILN